MNSFPTCPYPFVSSASSGSTSTTESATSAPPPPSLLNTLTVRETSSTSSLHPDQLRPMQMTTPALLPSALELMSIGPAKEETRLSKPDSLITTLERTVSCISRHGLLKSGQQVRQGQLELALDLVLPRELTGMIGSYALEVCFTPLQQTNYGCALRNPVNEPVLKCIEQIILSDDPDKHPFQLEMIKNHGDLLDSVFAPSIDYAEQTDLFDLAVRENPLALSQLRSKFELMVHYLPYSRCQTILEEESYAFKTYGDQADENIVKASQVNIRLLSDAMKKINPESETYQRRQAQQRDRADILVGQARDHLVKKQTAKACGLMFKAVEIYCRLRERRRVVEVLIQLIKLSDAGQTETDQNLFKFIDVARKLCLVYPSDSALYADLLFAVTQLCEKRQDFSTPARLYQQARDDEVRLPLNYHTKMLCMIVQVDQRSGMPTTQLVKRIMFAIDSIARQRRYTTPEKTSSGKKINDLSLKHHYVSCCQLYRLLGKLAEEQLAQFDTMNFGEQDDCVTLFMRRPTMAYSDAQFSTASPVRYNHPVWKMPRDWMVAVILDYYKTAIKNLKSFIVRPEESDIIESELISTYDSQVSLFRSANLVNDLDTLLNDAHIRQFMRVAGFKARFPEWHATLLAMREAGEKAKTQS